MPRGNQKQPIDLIIAKGKKHLTKADVNVKIKLIEKFKIKLIEFYQFF